MKNDQESVFSLYFESFSAQRVEVLTLEAEKTQEYLQGRNEIQEVIDATAKVMDSEALETLISAIRGADIPIFEYMYHAGIKDGIWISGQIEQVKKHR